MKASGGISEEATHIDRHKDIAPFEEAMIDRKWKKKGTGAGERLEKGVGKWKAGSQGREDYSHPRLARFVSILPALGKERRECFEKIKAHFRKAMCTYGYLVLQPCLSHDR